MARARVFSSTPGRFGEVPTEIGCQRCGPDGGFCVAWLALELGWGSTWCLNWPMKTPEWWGQCLYESIWSICFWLGVQLVTGAGNSVWATKGRSHPFNPMQFAVFATPWAWSCVNLRPNHMARDSPWTETDGLFIKGCSPWSCWPVAIEFHMSSILMGRGGQSNLQSVKQSNTPLRFGEEPWVKQPPTDIHCCSANLSWRIFHLHAGRKGDVAFGRDPYSGDWTDTAQLNYWWHGINLKDWERMAKERKEGKGSSSRLKVASKISWNICMYICSIMILHAGTPKVPPKSWFFQGCAALH